MFAPHIQNKVGKKLTVYQKFLSEGLHKALGLFLSIVFILGFPACRLQKNKQKQGLENPVHQNQVIMFNEARLVDVPIPLEAQWCFGYDYGEVGGYYATFMCPQAQDELIVYYQQEMEQTGWDHGTHLYHVCQENNAEQYPTLLVFDKPYKSCIITIRGNYVSLMILPKRIINLE